MRADWSHVALGLAFTACTGAGAISSDSDPQGYDADEREGSAVDPDLDAAGSPVDDAGNAGGARDAGGTDSGSASAGPPDAGGTADAGATSSAGCAGRSYKLCEDFEGASVGGLPAGWAPVVGWGGGEAVVSEDEAHSGTKSLAGANVKNGHNRAGTSLAGLGATADAHWGRIFFKVRAPATFPPAVEPPGFQWVHNTLVGLRTSTGESRVVDTVVSVDGKAQFLYNLPDDSCCQGSDYLYTPYDGSWHCAEWYVDAGAGQFRFYYDGDEVSLGFDASKARLGGFNEVVVGWMNYQTTELPYNQAWFDDLAIDDTRIGCGP